MRPRSEACRLARLGQQATAAEQPHDSFRYGGGNACDLRVVGCRKSVECRDSRALGVGIHAIKYEGMDMKVEIDRPTESL